MSAKKIKPEKPRSFFWKEVSCDEDIQRHRDEENSIRQKLKELELIPVRTEFEERARDAYLEIGMLLSNNDLKSIVGNLTEELMANKIGKPK